MSDEKTDVGSALKRPGRTARGGVPYGHSRGTRAMIKVVDSAARAAAGGQRGSSHSHRGRGRLRRRLLRSPRAAQMADEERRRAWASGPRARVLRALKADPSQAAAAAACLAELLALKERFRELTGTEHRKRTKRAADDDGGGGKRQKQPPLPKASAEERRNRSRPTRSSAAGGVDLPGVGAALVLRLRGGAPLAQAGLARARRPDPHAARRDRDARLRARRDERRAEGARRAAVARRGGHAAHVLQHVPPARPPGARDRRGRAASTPS